jgi:3-oxoacyl-[acyl-carrier-protein] synthase-3
MHLANSLIVSGMAETVLLAAATSASSYGACYFEPGITKERKQRLLVRDRLNASIFGDGAGALVLHKTSSLAKGILTTYWGATGIDNPVIFEGGGSRYPATVKTVVAGMHFFNVNVHSVKNSGIMLFEKTIQRILKQANLSITDIDYFVFHQVNYKLLQLLARRLNIPWEKVSVHVDRYGNLDTATLAVGFHEAKQENKILPGNLVLFAAIGAGWQYGAAIVRV